MAIATPAPDPDPAPDLLPLTEASLLLEPTGHPVLPRTLKQWLLKYGRTVISRRGMADRASWSDVLEVHAAEVDRASR